MTSLGLQPFKVGTGSLSLVLLCKNSIITFKRIVFQVIGKNTRLPHLSLALYLDHNRTLGTIRVISDSMCSYWLLCTVPLSNS